jgi:hypothetical protein
MMALFANIISDVNHSISRNFQFDYILCDAVFLAVFISLLVWRKRYSPLAAGLVCGILIYIIDGVVWSSLGIRQYGISSPWIKHPVDFMMDFSYGVVAFAWMWIAFERRSKADVALWTTVVFCGWLLVPLASELVNLDNDPIMTVRHMQSQVALQIGLVVAGYLLLAALRYRPGTIAYLFGVGCMLGFMMEVPLLVTNIRPAGTKLLVYETLILFNQGVPYLYVIWDKVLPAVAGRFRVPSVEKGDGHQARDVFR